MKIWCPLAIAIAVIASHRAAGQSTSDDAHRQVALRVARLETERQVAAATPATVEVRDGATWTPVSRRGLRVIAFDRAGRIRRLIDYPW